MQRVLLEDGTSALVTDKAAEGPDYYKRHAIPIQFRGKASNHTCESCGLVPAHDWSTLHEAPHGGWHPDDYWPLCQRCHLIYDGLPAHGAAAMSRESVRRKISKTLSGRKFSEERRQNMKAGWGKRNSRIQAQVEQELGTPVYRVKELTVITSIPDGRIFKAVRDGKLKSIQKDGLIFITQDDFREYLDEYVNVNVSI
jgi:hypothetical protein